MHYWKNPLNCVFSQTWEWRDWYMSLLAPLLWLCQVDSQQAHYRMCPTLLQTPTPPSHPMHMLHLKLHQQDQGIFGWLLFMRIFISSRMVRTLAYGWKGAKVQYPDSAGHFPRVDPDDRNGYLMEEVRVREMKQTVAPSGKLAPGESKASNTYLPNDLKTVMGQPSCDVCCSPHFIIIFFITACQRNSRLTCHQMLT